MKCFLVPLTLTTLLCLTTAAAPAENKVPEGFTPLFNGKDLDGWKVHDGKMDKWGVDNGLLFVKGGGGGWLMTVKEYDNYEVRLEYKLPKAGNSGVGIRAPRKGDPAYEGMEIQLLDNRDSSYKNLRPAQYTGSIYGVVPPSQDATKPAGEWNAIDIVAKGRQITVTINGKKVVDANLDDHKDAFKKHPGLRREKGCIGLQSHTGRVEFRNLYVKPL